jgi:hypothetical protein
VGLLYPTSQADAILFTCFSWKLERVLIPFAYGDDYMNDDQTQPLSHHEHEVAEGTEELEQIPQEDGSVVMVDPEDAEKL